MKLSAWEKSQLKKFLSKNLDVFAWSLTNIPRVDPSVICRKLSILSQAKPMKQKPWKMNAECRQALNNEIDQLLKADFIWETLYLKWLANPFLVKKKNEKWRVCIDYWPK